MAIKNNVLLAKNDSPLSSKEIEELRNLPVSKEEEMPSEAESKDFGVPEFLMRSAREGASGYSLGISEPIVNSIDAFSATVSDYINKKDYDGAQKFIDSFNNYYKGDVKRQEEFRKEYPTVSETANIVGSVLPGPSAGLKLAKGIESIFGPATTIPKMAAHMAAGGAAASALTKASEELTTAPFLDKTPEEQAKDIVESGAMGAAVGPLLGAGMVGATVTGSAIAKGTSNLTKKVALSTPVTKLVSTILGPSAEAQRNYVNAAKYIEELPSRDDVSLFLDQVKSELGTIDSSNKEDVVKIENNILQFKDELDKLSEKNKTESELLKENEKKAKETYKTSQKSLENKFIEDQKIAAESFKDQKSQNIKDAQDELNRILDNLTLQKQAAEQQLPSQKQTLEDKLKKPDLSPFRETLDLALDEVKKKLNEASANARSLLDPRYRIHKRVFIKAAKDELEKMGVRGTGGLPASPEIEEEQNQVRAFINLLEPFPEFLNADQVKDVLQQLDRNAFPKSKAQQPQPGQYLTKDIIAYKNIRQRIDEVLKKANPEYKQAMIPVQEMTKFLADNAKTFNQKTVNNLYDEALNTQTTRDKLLQLQQYTQQNVLEPLDLLQSHYDRNSKYSKLQAEAALPASQAIKQSQELLDILKFKDFENASLDNITDKDTAIKLIELKRNINTLKDEKFIDKEYQSRLDQYKKELASLQLEKFINEETGLTVPQELEQQIKIKQDQLDLEMKSKEAAIKKAKEFQNKFKSLLNNEQSQNIISVILRNPNNIVESENAAKIIRAITELPEEQFTDIIKTIGLDRPQDFDKMADYFRYDAAANQSYAQGSRRVLLLGALSSALSSVFGIDLEHTVGGAAFGGLVGAYLDKYGGDVTKTYLRSIANLGGLPTVSKLEQASPTPLTSALRNNLVSHISRLASQLPSNQNMFISNSMRPDIIFDVKNSTLSPIEKARSINEIQKTGFINSEIIKKMMLDSNDPNKKEKQLFDRVFEPKQSMLKYDSPQILKALEERGSKS